MKTITVGQLGKIITGNTPPRNQPCLYGNTTIFIKPTDISENSKYTYLPDECYSEKGSNKYHASLIPKGSTCVVTIGSIGNKMTISHTECFINQAMNAIIPNEDYDNEYVYYLLKNNLSNLKTLDSGTSSGRENVSKSAFSNMELQVIESIILQKRIGGILAAYDNLIENNQKQIKLLEESAMRLYKEWFVKLRFPGHENTPVVDGVPEGWIQSNFEFLCTHVKDSVTLREIPSEIPYIGLEHMPRKSFCLNEWGDSRGVKSNKFRYRKNDVLFGKIRPYFHKVGFALTNGICSTDAMVFRAKENMFGLLLMTAFSETFVNHTYQTCKEGSKMPRADWNEMKQYPVMIPHETVIKDFNKQIEKTTELVNELCMQTGFLKQARDKLLPKLMSGEIEVCNNEER